jgi:predicted nucleic acid-binding protein
VYLESEAKLLIQHKIMERVYDLVWSYILDYENSINPYEERKSAIAEWRTAAAVEVKPSNEICGIAKILAQKGLKTKDALHVACAIQAQCDYFLTTDKRLLNKPVTQLELINPLDFVRKMEEDT